MERRRATIIAAALIAVAAFVGLAVNLSRSGPEDHKRSAPPPRHDIPRHSTPPRPSDSVPAVIEPQELAAAHEVMREYLAALGTYTYRTDIAAWTAKTRALTDGSRSMTDQTSLPTGRAWAECKKTQCSSIATADLQRDTVLSNAPVDGAGRSVTTFASTAVTVRQQKKTTQHTDFQITATFARGHWKISGLQLAGVGNAGIDEGS